MTSRQGLGVGGGTVSLHGETVPTSLIIQLKRAKFIVVYMLVNVCEQLLNIGFSIICLKFPKTSFLSLELLQPYGFDVGQSERGAVLKGLDLGVEGMRVGGQVRTISGYMIWLFFLENSM